MKIFVLIENWDYSTEVDAYLFLTKEEAEHKAINLISNFIRDELDNSRYQDWDCHPYSEELQNLLEDVTSLSAERALSDYARFPSTFFSGKLNLKIISKNI